jgi:hypothetical protein
MYNRASLRVLSILQFVCALQLYEHHVPITIPVCSIVSSSIAKRRVSQLNENVFQNDDHEMVSLTAMRCNNVWL